MFRCYGLAKCPREPSDQTEGDLLLRNVKLPPELEFHDDIRLLVYRPHGVIDEAAVKIIVSVLEDLETRLQKPFDRFSHTLQADEVELNFKYVIQVRSVVGSRTPDIHP